MTIIEFLRSLLWEMNMYEVALCILKIKTKKDQIANPIFQGKFQSRMNSDICNYQVCYYYTNNGKNLWVTFGNRTMKLCKNRNTD